MRFLGLGGTDEVGASSYLYDLDGTRILIDAGLRPTMIGEASLPMLELLERYPPDLMLLTHAHLDHVGALPVVKRYFPKLPVYANRATARIAMDVLADAVIVGKLQGAPLYDLGEAMQAVASITLLEAFTPLSFAGGQLTTFPAGHILGAVGVLLESRSGNIFHTGDFSNIATMSVDKAYQPPQPVQVKAVVSEGTYGDTNLPGRKEQVRNFIQAIDTVISNGGRVLVPSFALGRAQELILLLLNHQASGILPRFPIYLDGLVRKLTQTVGDLQEALPEKLRNLAKTQEPFLRDQVVMIKNRYQRQDIIDNPHPALILASSGMLSGGVSPVYARTILGEVDSALFVVGYQDAESPGRRLLELERGGEVMLPADSSGNVAPVSALCYVSRYYLSAHADRVGILNHLSRYPSERAVIMHAEGGARASLADALRKDRYVELPKNGDWVDFEQTIQRAFPKKPSAQAATTDAPQLQPPSSIGKVKRFRTSVRLEQVGQSLHLHFDDSVNLESLFPPGHYRLAVTLGSIVKADLRQDWQRMQQEAQDSPRETPQDISRETPQESPSASSPDADVQALLPAALACILEQGKASQRMLREQLSCSTSQAQALLAVLEHLTIISPARGKQARALCTDASSAEQRLHSYLHSV